jgi:hypothetical protein
MFPRCTRLHTHVFCFTSSRYSRYPGTGSLTRLLFNQVTVIQGSADDDKTIQDLVSRTVKEEGRLDVFFANVRSTFSLSTSHILISPLSILFCLIPVQPVTTSFSKHTKLLNVDIIWDILGRNRVAKTVHVRLHGRRVGPGDSRKHSVVFPRHQVRRARDADHQHQDRQRGRKREHYFDCLWCVFVRPDTLASAMVAPGVRVLGQSQRGELASRGTRTDATSPFIVGLWLKRFGNLLQWPESAPEPDLSTVSQKCLSFFWDSNAEDCDRQRE